MSARQAPSWLKLLAPLPEDARPQRKSVAPPGSLHASPDSPIAGWETLLLELSAHPFGTRIFLVTLDATHRPISASDHVMLRGLTEEGGEGGHMRQASIGGRIEVDGSFRGTHWTMEGREPEGDEDPDWDRTSRAATGDEAADLLRLVKDVAGRTHRAE